MTVAGDGFEGVWPAEPDNVAAARHAVVEWLRSADTKDPPLGDIEVVVSEALTNAVVHAYLDDEPGEVRVNVELLPDEVQVVVEDGGRGMMPRTDSPGLGLGLPLIATLADRFDAATVPGGGTRLCAWFRRTPRGSELPS